MGEEPGTKHCPCAKAGRSQLSRECPVLCPAQPVFPSQSWHHAAKLCPGRKRVGVQHLFQAFYRGNAEQTEGTVGSPPQPPSLPLSPFLPSGCFFPSVVCPPGQTEGQFWGPCWNGASRQSTWMPGTPQFGIWHLPNHQGFAQAPEAAPTGTPTM